MKRKDMVVGERYYVSRTQEWVGPWRTGYYATYVGHSNPAYGASKALMKVENDSVLKVPYGFVRATEAQARAQIAAAKQAQEKYLDERLAALDRKKATEGRLTAAGVPFTEVSILGRVTVPVEWLEALLEKAAEPSVTDHWGYPVNEDGEPIGVTNEEGWDD